MALDLKSFPIEYERGCWAKFGPFTLRVKLTRTPGSFVTSIEKKGAGGYRITGRVKNTTMAAARYQIGELASRLVTKKDLGPGESVDDLWPNWKCR